MSFAWLTHVIYLMTVQSMRATYVKHYGKPSLPPIQVTIVGGEHDVGIRISDQGKRSKIIFEIH